MIKQAHPAYDTIRFISGAERRQARTMNNKSDPLIMNQTHNRIPQKVSAKKTHRGVSAMARTGGLTHRARLLPARDGKERADARIPPKRAIR